jgi:hypothetical protein
MSERCNFNVSFLSSDKFGCDIVPVAEQQKEIEMEQMKCQGKELNMSICEYCNMCDLNFLAILFITNFIIFFCFLCSLYLII